jgi:hypothetical protein
MVEEAGAKGRYGVRGGCSPSRRERIARSLPPDTDYAELYRAAVDAQAAR